MKQEYRVFGIIAAVVGLLLLAAVGTLAQQVIGHVGGDMGYVPGLRQNPITADQRQQIISIRQNMYSQIQDIRSNQDLSQQEMNAQISQVMQDTNAQVMSVLTPEQQQEFSTWWKNRQERTEQMTGPGARMGAGPKPRAGAGPGMMQKGNMNVIPGLRQNPLTADQRQRIAAIRRQTQNQMLSVRRDRSLSMQQKNSRIADIQNNAHTQIMNVLTSAQREEFMQWWQNHPGSQR